MIFHLVEELVNLGHVVFVASTNDDVFSRRIVALRAHSMRYPFQKIRLLTFVRWIIGITQLLVRTLNIEVINSHNRFRM